MEHYEPDYTNLQAIVGHINASHAGVRAYLDTHYLRPSVELEPVAPAEKIAIDAKLADNLAQLLADTQLGYLRVRHTNIQTDAVPILAAAIATNRTAIEICLSSQLDLVSPAISAALMDALGVSNNLNLDVFQPSKHVFGKENVRRANNYIDAIQQAPLLLAEKNFHEINDRLPLIETLAHVRYVRDPQGMASFARNLVAVAAAAEQRGILIAVAPFYRKLAATEVEVAPEPIEIAPAPAMQVTEAAPQGRGQPVHFHASAKAQLLDELGIQRHAVSESDRFR